MRRRVRRGLVRRRGLRVRRAMVALVGGGLVMDSVIVT